MTKKIDLLLKEILEEVSVSKEEYKKMASGLNEFLKKIEGAIKKRNIVAQIFVGGSFAKKTLVKKEKYDADVFIRFDKKYKKEELSKILKKILDEVCRKEKIALIHGSRDYFKINLSEKFYLEIVPVRKINSIKDYENITDLSYSHVNYLKKKIKSEKILEQIKIAKSFVSFSNCYGAESYISGFSGYSLELLILFYGSFEKFLRGMLKSKEKEVIDIEKLYKNKQEVLLNLNSSKLSSPIILIDPTYKQRNALAALSKETFEKFKKVAQEFLKNPSKEYFKNKNINLEEKKEKARKEKKEFKLIRIGTEKQEGDIAGSKLLKFYKNFIKEISNFYTVYESGFNYSGKQEANFYIVVKNKEIILFNGPSINDEKAAKEFRKKHKIIEIKNKKLLAKEKFKLEFKEFFNIWKKKNIRKIKEMYLNKIEILE